MPVIHREITGKMLEFINKHHAKVPAVYIHGPQGVGKSCSLFEIVCQLNSDKSNRVIYIPDCGGWANDREPLAILLDAICMAFAEDNLLASFECVELNEKVWQQYVILSHPS
jgi:Cdc6-like AAA superfamily ATPase